MIWILLFLFQLKHFLADYVLQTEYMLRKQMERDWLSPLMLHCLIHGFGTLFICVVVNPKLSWLAILDVGVHFLIDRTKASYSRAKTPANKYFWIALGADQSLHHLSHYWLIWFLLQRSIENS